MPYVRAILASRYRLDELIGSGAVGEVWRGLDVVLERPVAVKLLRAEYAQHSGTLARFRAEARHAGSLSYRASPTFTTTASPIRRSRRSW